MARAARSSLDEHLDSQVPDQFPTGPGQELAGLGVKALVQRVLEASVRVGDREVSSIGRGLLVFLGVAREDGERHVETLAKKVSGLRLFDDDSGRMNLSNGQIGGAYLVVSQFTLCADLSRGHRPSFDAAMKPPKSERLYETFCERLGTLTGLTVRKGEFGAAMVVSLKNEGPATFQLEA